MLVDTGTTIGKNLPRDIDCVQERMSHLAVRPQVVCLICRIRASGSVPRASFSTTTKRFESLSVTERMRRRIWGTNSPPGQTDPYAQLTQEERERDLQRQKTAEVNERAADVEKKVSHVYVPASNWDGLESVGGFGDDSTATWDPEHQFQGWALFSIGSSSYSRVVEVANRSMHRFMTSAQLTSASELTMAIHQAAVEIYTLHGAQQSLASATKMEGSTGLTADVQIVPSNNALQVDLLYPSDKTRDDILSSVKTNVAGGPGDQKIEEGFDEKQEQGADAHREKALPSEHTDTHGKAEAKATEAWRPMAAWAIEEQRLRDHPTESHAKNIEQLEAQMSSWNPDWLSTPLTGPHIKFAVRFRLEPHCLLISVFYLLSADTLSNPF